MTAVRDFNAPRNASFWQMTVVQIVCDGPHEDGERPQGVRGVTASEARKDAREQGWTVAVSSPGSNRRLDFCPAHRDA